jgi:exopolysaccharide biosynthesis polyprenyl glycosylphosphotransferase
MASDLRFDPSILPKSHFLNCLRIEKRRVDRSKAPLSIVLFCFHQEEKRGEESVQNFSASLQRSTRETDIKGWVDHNVIGLILPDTDEKGVQSFVGKILDGNGDTDYSVVTGTYPNQLFQKLLSEDQGLPDLYPLLLEDSGGSQRFQHGLKRAIDVVGSLVGILLLSPVMFVIALAVKGTSPGPAIFDQTRLGKKGARFRFFKFRSMYFNEDDQIHREYVEYLITGQHGKINQGNDQEPLYKMKDDPRVTRVGRIIRKLSIDELPQLFNVLRGEMSLVGPRPPLPYEVERYEPWHLRRILEVKPGMTGLWQVDGRSKTSFDDMVRLDLRYVLSWSLWLDLKILAKTVRAVIRPNGAL